MKRYEAYKAVQPLWNMTFPKHWEVFPLYSIAKEKSICNCTELELLSVYLDAGVVPFSKRTEKRTNATSKDLSKYQRVDPGDFVLNNQQAWRGSVGVSKHTGITSPAYIVLSMNVDRNSPHLYNISVTGRTLRTTEYKNVQTYFMRVGIVRHGIGALEVPNCSTTPLVLLAGVVQSRTRL